MILPSQKIDLKWTSIAASNWCDGSITLTSSQCGHDVDLYMCRTTLQVWNTDIFTFCKLLHIKRDRPVPWIFWTTIPSVWEYSLEPHQAFHSIWPPELRILGRLCVPKKALPHTCAEFFWFFESASPWIYMNLCSTYGTSCWGADSVASFLFTSGEHRKLDLAYPYKSWLSVECWRYAKDAFVLQIGQLLGRWKHTYHEFSFESGNVKKDETVRDTTSKLFAPSKGVTSFSLRCHICASLSRTMATGVLQWPAASRLEANVWA